MELHAYFTRNNYAYSSTPSEWRKFFNHSVNVIWKISKNKNTVFGKIDGACVINEKRVFIVINGFTSVTRMIDKVFQNDNVSNLYYMYV